MKVGQLAERFENSKFCSVLRRMFNSVYFPPVTAIVTLLCYYLGWDVVMFWYLGICGLGILLSCKDVTPFFCLVLFIHLTVSYKNSPSQTDNPVPTDYYFRPAITAQIGVVIGLLVAGIIARMVIGIVKGRFKIDLTFIGLCVFSVTLLLCGLFFKGYTAMNLLFSFALVVILLGVFVFVYGNITINEDTFKKIAYYLIIYFGVLAIELVVAYLTIDGLVSNGSINRGKLFFGWGIYNNFGALVTMTLPAWFYFASGKSKYSVLFLLGAVANLVIIVLSMSRQAILMGAIIFIICCVWNLVKVKGKQRVINVCVMAGIFIVLIIVAGVMYKKVIEIFVSLTDNFENGSGRTDLWKVGIANFKKYPAFGVGWFGSEISEWDRNASGLAFIPRMFHNTFVQLLASCGIIGFLGYVVHRVQTIYSFFKNVTHERTLLALTILGLLLTSLLDNHIFYIFPTLMYAFLLPILARTESKDGEDGLGTLKLKLATLFKKKADKNEASPQEQEKEGGDSGDIKTNAEN